MQYSLQGSRIPHARVIPGTELYSLQGRQSMVREGQTRIVNLANPGVLATLRFRNSLAKMGRVYR
ncbi:hypothetical protein HOC01_04845 [archaeon]|jgi:hypothetical protein|nr:hypothetical protein [archaeon]MBT6698295.1 hypothetical protein [archaeon]